MRADLMLKTDHHVIRSIKQLDRDDKLKAKTNRLLDSSFSRVAERMKKTSGPDAEEFEEELKKIAKPNDKNVKNKTALDII